MAWQTPKTNWKSSDVVSPTDMNRIEGNINSIENDSRTIDPTQAPSSNVGILNNFLNWFANRIKAITGKTNWYDAPSKTLEDLNTHINNTNNPHNVTAAQIGYTASDVLTKLKTVDGAGSGLDADMIDGAHLNSLWNTTNLQKAYGKVSVARNSSVTVTVNFQPSIVIGITFGTVAAFLYGESGNIGNTGAGIRDITSTGFTVYAHGDPYVVYYLALI